MKTIKAAQMRPETLALIRKYEREDSIVRAPDKVGWFKQILLNIKKICNICNNIIETGEEYSTQLLLDAKADARLNALDRANDYKAITAKIPKSTHPSGK